MSFEEKIKNLTPAQMDALLEKVNDIKLMEKAEKALENYNSDTAPTLEDVLKSTGLTKEDLDSIEVEIE